MQLISGRAAQKSRNESRKLSMFSKQWLPGETLRAFYPIFKSEDGQWDIAVGQTWGHSVSDIKKLGLHTAFIPSKTQFDNQTARPIGTPDVAYQFSLIAKAFVDGMHAQEEKALLEKPMIDENLRQEALKELEHKYDTKNNMKAVKPIIGRAQFYICTECLVVKYANNMPILDSMVVVSQPLSDQKLQQLYAILDSQQFAPQDGDQYLEVEWKFPPGAEKSQSARNCTVSGISSEYKIMNQAPQAWDKIKAKLVDVQRDAETITRRATTMVDEEKVRAAIAKYSMLNFDALNYLSEESVGVLKRNINVVHSFGLMNHISNEETMIELQSALDKYNESLAEQETVTESIPSASPILDGLTTPAQQTNIPAPMPNLGEEVAAQPAPAPTPTPASTPAAPAESTLSATTTPTPDLNPAAPTLDSLMNNPNRYQVDEQEFSTQDILL